MEQYKFDINKMKKEYEKRKPIVSKDIFDDTLECHANTVYSTIKNLLSIHGIAFFYYHDDKKFIYNTECHSYFFTESILLLKESIIKNGLVFIENNFGFIIKLN